MVDNTFATPVVCRPLEWQVDLVMESLSKAMNGHSDVMLGLLAGAESLWERVPLVQSAWGFSSSPLDCWLAERGLATLALRMERSCENALGLAQWLQQHPAVARVDYPGLESHVDHALARRQFGERFGAMVTFHLKGGLAAAERLFGSGRLPFCPSLGEVSTTVSHPESTSHRGLTTDERQQLGISGGTIRVSVGTESFDFIAAALSQSLDE